MSFSDILKGLGKAVGENMVSDLQDKVDVTIEDAKKRIEETTEMVIKKILGMTFMIIGLIFGLVGIAQYISKVYPALEHGIGYVLVGLILILLGFAAHKNSKKEVKCSCCSKK